MPGTDPQNRIDQALELELFVELVREFEAPCEEWKEPFVVEEPTDDGKVRLFVVWSRWAGISPEIRAKLIAEAAEQGMPAEEYTQIGGVVGLTEDEAESFGLFVEPLED